MTDISSNGHAEAERLGGWFEDSNHPGARRRWSPELWTEEAVRMHPEVAASASSSKTRWWSSVGTRAHRTQSEGMSSTDRVRRRNRHADHAEWWTALPLGRNSARPKQK